MAAAAPAPDSMVTSDLRRQLAAFRAAHPPRRAVLNGTEWTYLAGGSGSRALLILPGAAGRPDLAFRQMTDLEPDFRILAACYPPLHSMTALVDDLAALLDHEDIAQAHVLGGSYGGVVAQCFVRRHPQRVTRMILSHTGAPNPKRVPWVRAALRILPWFPFGLLRSAMKVKLRRLLSGLPNEMQFWNEYFEETLPLFSREDLMAGYSRVLEWDRDWKFAPGDLNGWPVKILILESDNDPMAPPAERARLHALYPTARVYTFHDTGHISGLAKPVEYVSVVRDFLS